MRKSKFKIVLSLLLILLIMISLNLKSFAGTNKTVLLGGHSIGLKLDTGIYVAGLYQVETKDGVISPWINSDIKEGDKIVKYNGNVINNNNDLLNKLKNENEKKINLTIDRSGKVINTNIEVVLTKNNHKSIGLYIKDRILGIGTMTFIDPVSMEFASLGHAVYDDNLVIGAQNGTITKSSIDGIKKGISGAAGEKRATLTNQLVGSIKTNKITGVYGKISNRASIKGDMIQTASQKEVKLGKAKIYTVIKDEKIESFDILITGINLQDSVNIKGLKFEVTDDELLEKTGGIIQGMSGSPIVQNNYLIGAVSHVSIDNPKVGYGVHIEWMLSDL